MAVKIEPQYGPVAIDAYLETEATAYRMGDADVAPEGYSTYRSLSAIEPVCGPPKWKLQNGAQRPAPETRPSRTEMPNIAGQRLGRASLTRGTEYCGNPEHHDYELYLAV